LFFLQDTFLTHVEDGTIILLGATTENPSFQLNSALLSRCRVIVLEKLQPPEIEGLLRRALPRIGAKEDTNSKIDGPRGMTVNTGEHIRFDLSWQHGYFSLISISYRYVLYSCMQTSCLLQDMMHDVTLQ